LAQALADCFAQGVEDMKSISSALAAVLHALSKSIFALL
jgi:hypothetical protein